MHKMRNAYRATLVVTENWSDMCEVSVNVQIPVESFCIASEQIRSQSNKIQGDSTSHQQQRI
jgi:hypothetical protein